MVSNSLSNRCYQGVKHEGIAEGKLCKLSNFEVYIVGEKSDYGIIILTDIMGHKFLNAQLIADQIAANGYLVLMPDLFDQNPVELNRPGNFNIAKWLKGGYHPRGREHLPPNVDPVIESCIIEMRQNLGIKKIGAVGYCFGGKYVVRHLQPTQGKFDAGFIAHPSSVDEKELEDVKGPLSVAAAETDAIFSTDMRHRTEELLKACKLPYQVNLYAGVEHGFAVRADLKDRRKKNAKEAAFLQGLQWFNEHLKG